MVYRPLEMTAILTSVPRARPRLPFLPGDGDLSQAVHRRLVASLYRDQAGAPVAGCVP